MAPRKKPMPLTLKELNVLEFIEMYMLDQGVAPTFQQICDYFGFASLNSVQRYLKQLQEKNYIYIPGGNQKRAMQILHPSKSISNLLSNQMVDSTTNVPNNQNPALSQNLKKEAPLESMSPPSAESLSLPLLGRVAAGAPIEAFTHDEYISVPAAMIRNPSKTFALIVQGQSMVEDGILDGDVIFVQKQTYASNGDTVVAMVNNQATVKRFYLHSAGSMSGAGSLMSGKRKIDVHSNPQTDAHSADSKQVELRPANSTMQSMWHPPSVVDIQGIVVGLIRRFS
jgi:repressor LexA